MEGRKYAGVCVGSRGGGHKGEGVEGYLEVCATQFDHGLVLLCSGLEVGTHERREQQVRGGTRGEMSRAAGGSVHALSHATWFRVCVPTLSYILMGGKSETLNAQGTRFSGEIYSSLKYPK